MYALARFGALCLLQPALAHIHGNGGAIHRHGIRSRGSGPPGRGQKRLGQIQKLVGHMHHSLPIRTAPKR